MGLYRRHARLGGCWFERAKRRCELRAWLCLGMAIGFAYFGPVRVPFSAALAAEDVSQGDAPPRGDWANGEAARPEKGGQSELRPAARETEARQRGAHAEEHWTAVEARLLVAHVERIASLTPEGRRQADEMTRLRGEALLCARECKRAESVALLKQALAISEKLLGEEDVVHLDVLSDLREAYDLASDYRRAETVGRRVLALQRTLRGRWNPRYLDSLTRLLGPCFEQEKYAATESLMQEAYEVATHLFGERHRRTAEILLLLGLTRLVQGDYSGAERHYRSSLKMFTDLDLEESVAYAECTYRLAQVHCMMGYYHEAKKEAQEATELVRRKFPNHRALIGCLMAESSVCLQLGEYGRAEALLRDVLQTCQRLLPKDDSRFVLCRRGLGAVYLRTKSYDRAEGVFKDILAIRERTYGKQHGNYQVVLGDLAELYYEKGDYALAERVLRDALGRQKRGPGLPDLTYARLSETAGRVYVATGDYQQAEPLLLTAGEVYRKALREGHPDHGRSLYYQGQLYLGQGKLDKAEQSLVEAIKIYEQTFGKSHRKLLEVLEARAQVLRSAKRDKEAVQVESRVADIRASASRERKKETKPAGSTPR